MKLKIKIAFVAIAAISFSCSSDTESIIETQTTSLSQRIVYIPQSTNFINKLVTNYANNKKSSEINYNASGAVTQTSEFTYGPGTSTTLDYNGQNVLTGKTIYNYDLAGRISVIEFYNNQNQLTGKREYEYQNSDINVYYIQSGVSTLIFHYKTNSAHLIYYEKKISSGLEQTLTYSGERPVQLVASSGLQLTYEFYPTIIPLPLQKNSTELNNSILISLSVQQIKEICNYHLQKTSFTGSYTRYEKEFDSGNYITHDLVKTIVTHPFEERINSETIYYYQ